jgi:ATP synthase protein I
MSHPDESDDDSRARDDQRLSDLQRRLREREAKEAAKRAGTGRHAQMGALGAAWRMSVELVVALMVGGAIGLGLDRLFKTAPWIMVVGLAFGFAAGVRSAIRSAYAMQVEPTGAAVPDDEEDDEDRD